MSGHHSAASMTDQWLTPPEIISALGAFDLDPCSPVQRPWDTALKHYNIHDDGFRQQWHGRVWCNPPYGAEGERWLAKCAAHGNAVALIFARTETRSFFRNVWGAASAVLFIEGRLHFHKPDGSRAKANAGAPSVLVAYGNKNADCLRDCGISGKFIRLTDVPD